MKELNRRRFLMGSVGATTGLALTTSRSLAIDGEDLEGIAYNPETREILGDAQARLVQTPDAVQGVLRIGSQSYSIDLTNPLQRQTGERFTGRLPDVVDRHGIPYKIRFIRTNTGATGYVSPYGAKTMTSFTVVRKSLGLNREDAIHAVTGGV